MFVLLPENCCEDNIPLLLKSIQRCKTDDELSSALLSTLMTGLRTDLDSCNVEKEQQLSCLRSQLASEVEKVTEARRYLRDARFWDTLVDNKSVHIFTCGRDSAHSLEIPRGYGGRTSIDLWDYRSVLDITHYFASRQPTTLVTIEEPTSKLSNEDLRQAPNFADRIADFQGALQNRNCIIVGSPDVNDFAEVVLSSMHGIDPYTRGRKKTKGYAIIKTHEFTTSSFYWQSEGQEQEGIVRILGDGNYEYFPHKLAESPGERGEMHGVLVIGNNPFQTAQSQGKVVVLSGFSGVATNAIAKLLTDDHYVHEYFQLGRRYVDFDKNVEALVTVEYEVEGSSLERDTRRIRSIVVKQVVEI